MIRFRPLFVVASLALTAAVGAQAPQVSGAQALYNTAGNLGFATVRSAFAVPEQPLRQDAHDWVVRDLTTVKQWSAQLTSCVSFNPNRLDDAMWTVQQRPPSRDVWRVVDQLHRDYAAAVANGSCASGLASIAQASTVYHAGLFMGFAVARASYFYSDAPIAAQVIGQIRGDVGQVVNDLRNLAPCVGSSAAAEARLNDILGRMPTTGGRRVWEELAAAYQEIDTLFRAPKCAPSMTTQTPAAGSCMDSKCGNQCKGAVVMLGVVSGSAECQVCMNTNCGG